MKGRAGGDGTEERCGGVVPVCAVTAPAPMGKKLQCSPLKLANFASWVLAFSYGIAGAIPVWRSQIFSADCSREPIPDTRGTGPLWGSLARVARLEPSHPARSREAASWVFEPGATLGSTAAAGARIIVWCRACRHRVEPDPAVMARRYGADTAVRDWHKRLICSRCGGREVDFVLTDARR